MSLVNGILMFFVAKILLIQRINKIFIFSLVFNFYSLALFFSAERLKFSLLFFVLFLYYFNNKRKGLLLLFLSVLTHVQTVLLLSSTYINRIYRRCLIFFKTGRLKKTPYFLVALVVSIAFVYILKDHLSSKFNSYIGQGFNLISISKPFMFVILSYFANKNKKDFMKILILFLPIIVGSFIFGESRIVIFAYFLFLFVSFKKSPRINIYILLTSLYFFYKGVLFLDNVMLYGNGY